MYFVGDRAYKLKKPVDLGFVDFSTRQARQRACLREVELNRRFGSPLSSVPAPTRPRALLVRNLKPTPGTP